MKSQSAENAAMLDQEKRQLERLGRARTREIVGIVDSLDVHYLRPLDAGDGRLFFWLKPWRPKNGILRKGRLDVFRLVDKQEHSRLRQLIRPYTILRLRVRLRTPFFGSDEALLEEVIGVDNSDAKLSRVLASLDFESIDDPVLGRLTCQPPDHHCFGLANWDGNDVSVTLALGKDGNIADARKVQEVAHLLWRNQHDWEQRIRAFAVKTLLPEKNAETSEDEKPLTAAQFDQRIQIDSITVYADGSFEFFYEDDGMFEDGIFVRGSLSAGPNEAFPGGQ